MYPVGYTFLVYHTHGLTTLKIVCKCCEYLLVLIWCSGVNGALGGVSVVVAQRIGLG